MTDPVPAAEIARVLGHPLPQGASHIRSARWDGIDSLILVRFQSGAAEAEAFVRAVTGKPPTRGLDPGLGYLGQSLDWWPATAPAGSAGGETRTPANQSIKLLVIPSAKDVTVFVAAFTS